MERQPRSSSSVTIPASTDGRKSATDKSKMSASLIIGAGRVRTKSMTRSKAPLYACTAKMARSSSWLETSGSGVPLTTASESSVVMRYPSIVVLWYASYCFAWRALPTSRASDNPWGGPTRSSRRRSRTLRKRSRRGRFRAGDDVPIGVDAFLPPCQGAFARGGSGSRRHRRGHRLRHRVDCVETYE